MADRAGARFMDIRRLRDYFPALVRLGATDRRKIPYIQQLAANDCGVAALIMVLAYFGKRVPADEVRRICGTGRSGTDALSLVSAARWFGMRARTVRVEIEGLRFIPRGAILHWEFNHFVVFDQLTRKGLRIVDPAAGPRLVPLERFRKSFTGVAIFLEPGEAFTKNETQRGRLQRYTTVLTANALILGQVVVSSVLLRVLALAGPLMTGLLVDRVIGRGDHDLILVLVVGASGVLLFNLSTMLVRAYLTLGMRTLMEATLTLGFVDHLVRLPYDYFESRSTGDLMVRMGSHTRVRDILTNAMMSAALDGTLALLYFFLLFLGNLRLAIIALIFGTSRVVVMLLFRHRNQVLIKEALETQSKTTHHQVELLSGIETLKSSGAEDAAVEQWSHTYIDSLNVSIRQGRLAAVSGAMMGLLDQGAPLAIITIGALEVLAGSLSLGQMLALNSLALAVLGPLGSLVGAWGEVQLLGGYLDRIDDVFAAQPEQIREQARPAPRVSGQLNVDNVWFRYTPTAPNVLEGINLAIEQGQSIAIVGRSGSGKSTLGRLLVGLYRPTAGKIFFDDIDLVTLDLPSVRRQLGVVLQNARLFSGSIRSNIAGHHGDVSLEAVVHAAKLAEIHDDIMTMAMGYETPLSNAGSTLSGGQRQRLSIARALVHEPPILLLDEATSSLDQLTEHRIQTNLEKLDCTRIVIAHRLSTIADVNRIIVLDGGKIVETGQHQDLLAANGLYARLVRTQGAQTRPHK